MTSISLIIRAGHLRIQYNISYVQEYNIIGSQQGGKLCVQYTLYTPHHRRAVYILYTLLSGQSRCSLQCDYLYPSSLDGIGRFSPSLFIHISGEFAVISAPFHYLRLFASTKLYSNQSALRIANITIAQRHQNFEFRLIS